MPGRDVIHRLPWWRAPEGIALPDRTSGSALVSAMPAPGMGSRVSYRALMVFTFILLLAPQQWFPVLAPLRIALLAAVVGVLAHVGGRLAAHQNLFRFDAPLTTVALLAGWSVVTVPFSVWPGGSVSYLLEFYFKTLVVFALLANVINSLDRLRGISWLLVLLAVPLALTTVKNYLGGNGFGDSDRVLGYAAALTENPNDMALMLNLILPFTIALFLVSRSAGQRLMLGAVVGLLVAAILLTFSRSGFLTLGVVVSCWLWKVRNRKEWVWGPALLLLMLMAVPLMPASWFDRIGSIVSIEEDTTGSSQVRMQDMKVALKLGLANPLSGAGIGMNALAMNEVRGTTWTEIHNVYLQYLIELGLPGLLLFLMLFRSCLASAATVVAKTRGREDMRMLCHLAEAIQVSLLAFAVAAMFHPVAYHFYFYYIAGLAAALPVVLRQQQPASGVPAA